MLSFFRDAPCCLCTELPPQWLNTAATRPDYRILCKDALMQWHTDMMMLLHCVKADGGKKLGWEGGSTVQLAVWFTHKEQSPILCPQTWQKQTTCRQPASPPTPACALSSLRSPHTAPRPALSNFCLMHTKCSLCPKSQTPGFLST